MKNTFITLVYPPPEHKTNYWGCHTKISPHILDHFITAIHATSKEGPQVADPLLLQLLNGLLLSSKVT